MEPEGSQQPQEKTVMQCMSMSIKERDMRRYSVEEDKSHVFHLDMFTLSPHEAMTPRQGIGIV